MGFDACSGGKDRTATVNTETENTKSGHDDGGQIETIESISLNAWGGTADDKNPDYKLVLIHAANTGYVAKSKAGFGSYLIYLFAKRIMNNIEESKGKELIEIMDEIANVLHDMGKQLPTPLYNNNTRTLQFEIEPTIASELE